ncbi:hypothetical protein [Helicobacter sp. 23-1045]
MKKLICALMLIFSIGYADKVGDGEFFIGLSKLCMLDNQKEAIPIILNVRNFLNTEDENLMIEVGFDFGVLAATYCPALWWWLGKMYVEYDEEVIGIWILKAIMQTASELGIKMYQK